MKNNRTFLEKLLDGAKVEWKTLDEISSIYGGLTGKGKADFENGNALYVPYKNIFNNIEVDFNNLETVNMSDDEKQYTIKYGDILFTGSSETAEEAGMSSAVTTKIEQKIYLNSFSFGLRFNDDVELLPEFSKFLFRTLSIRKEIVKSASGVTRFNISKARFKKIKIPIPPLPVQTEIVKILDALTALTSELTSELILRRKQYEYYREKLLSEEELGKVGFEWKCLKHIFNIFAGGDVHKEFYSQHKTQEFNIPILSNGTGNKSLYGWTNKAKINKPSLTISARGTIGWTSYREEPFYPIVRLLVLTPKIELNLKYAYHFMKMIENNYKVPESGIPQLTKPMIEELRIPVPSFSEQQSIASILDKFEILNNSITDGLPLAIEQSQKRYEYYRELLLNFPGRE